MNTVFDSINHEAEDMNDTLIDSILRGIDDITADMIDLQATDPVRLKQIKVALLDSIDFINFKITKAKEL